MTLRSLFLSLSSILLVLLAGYFLIYPLTSDKAPHTTAPVKADYEMISEMVARSQIMLPKDFTQTVTLTEMTFSEEIGEVTFVIEVQKEALGPNMETIKTNILRFSVEKTIDCSKPLLLNGAPVRVAFKNPADQHPYLYMRMKDLACDS